MFGSLPNSPENPPEDGAQTASGGLRKTIGYVIFEHDTRSAKAFDVSLLVAILASIVIVMLESVEDIRFHHRHLLVVLEWGFTILFSLEYFLRIYAARKRARYVFSFYGAIDLLSVVPTYLSLVVPGGQALVTLRALRLLRVFRVMHLYSYLREADVLGRALQGSVRKIIVFLGVVLTLAVIMGSLMYVVEGKENGFTSIPRGMYWAIVTMTTVGYGDIAPHTVVGQMIASLVMIMGYGIIAVPTGIVSAELVQGRRRESKEIPSCLQCDSSNHDLDAKFCKLCGASL